MQMCLCSFLLPPLLHSISSFLSLLSSQIFWSILPLFYHLPSLLLTCFFCLSYNSLSLSKDLSNFSTSFLQLRPKSVLLFLLEFFVAFIQLESLFKKLFPFRIYYISSCTFLFIVISSSSFISSCLCCSWFYVAYM